ncbi:GntR family transcriptional regulator [Cohaesibacter celericrescens]|uniref:GntR family transcriptional regulator n=1 Tax=Cohaesibacter celericrescens TaxID=2067669 RepID=UPI00356922C0
MTGETQLQEIERPPSLSDIATEKLRAAICSGEFELGEALSEKKLAERLNISKTPIRHALAQMKVEGLVEVFPQKGTFVFTLKGTHLDRFFEHRFILETAALRLSYERNREALLATLEKISQKMERSKKKEDRLEYLNLDVQYHQCFFDMCDNPYLAESSSLIEAKVSAIRNHLGKNRIQTTKSLEEHKEMIVLLRSGKVDECIALLDFHIGRYHRTYNQTDGDTARTYLK